MERQLEFKNEETDSVNLFESKIISMIFNYETSKTKVIRDRRYCGKQIHILSSNTSTSILFKGNGPGVVVSVGVIN